MARNVFIVDAYQINGEGTKSHIANYPKEFDSTSYNDDVDLALKRATGAFAKAWGGFCDVDNMQLQNVTLRDITGFQIDSKTVGSLPVDPQPEE